MKISPRTLDLHFAEKVLGWENFRTLEDGITKGRPPYRGKGLPVPYFLKDSDELFYGVLMVGMEFTLTFQLVEQQWSAMFNYYNHDYTFTHIHRELAIMMACLIAKGHGDFVAGYMAGLKLGEEI